VTDVPPEPSFDDLDWTVTADGAREKVVERDGKRVRLVELTDAFVHEEWCSRGHVVSVLDGALELTFRDHVERIEAGDICVIPSGYDQRHKPRALTPIVQMLVIDDL
jgi:quercetin dioxygenase-like cupin family protein